MGQQTLGLLLTRAVRAVVGELSPRDRAVTFAAMGDAFAVRDDVDVFSVPAGSVDVVLFFGMPSDVLVRHFARVLRVGGLLAGLAPLTVSGPCRGHDALLAADRRSPPRPQHELAVAKALRTSMEKVGFFVNVLLREETDAAEATTRFLATYEAEPDRGALAAVRTRAALPDAGHFALQSLGCLRASP